MKKYLFSILTIITIITFTSTSVYAEHPEITGDCMNELKGKYEEFTNDIFVDVLDTYKEINKQKEDRNSIYFTFEKIRDTTVLLGRDDEQLNSLSQFFGGVSKGDKRLYFFNGDINSAYLLYKEPTNQNVMIQLKRTEKAWVEVKREVKKGKDIELEKPKCIDEYLLRRWFFETFGEYKVF